MTRHATLAGIVLCAIASGPLNDVVAQFTPGLLTNDSYWNDGKAEFDIYDAQLIRAGQLRRCEVIHIYFREKLDPGTFTVADPKRPDGLSAVRMNQIWSVPLGMFVEQGSITGYWRLDSVMLACLTFVGTDSSGNICKRLEHKPQGDASTVVFNTDSYLEKATTNTTSVPPNAIFYDELPLRIRTIDWTKPPAEFEVQLCPSLVASSQVEFQPAKISWKTVGKEIEATVHHSESSDRFVIDREFPHLVREWQMADGSRLRMKQGLKADYWNYAKEGDRERALKNPMLQHPD